MPIMRARARVLEPPWRRSVMTHRTLGPPSSWAPFERSASDASRSLRPIVGLDETIVDRAYPGVLVREVVSAGGGSGVLVDECIIGGDQRLVLLTEGLDPTREASLRT